MARQERPDLAISVYETTPLGFEDEFVQTVAKTGASVRSARVSNGLFLGLELYLPFAVMIYVAAKYFDGFISRAGETHYDAFVGAAKKLWRRARLIRVTPIGSAGKVSTTPAYVLSFSIVGEVAPGLQFKLVLRLDAGEAESEVAIEAFLKLIRDLHAGALTESDISALLSYDPIGGTALVTFDGETGQIVPVNGRNRT